MLSISNWRDFTLYNVVAQASSRPGGGGQLPLIHDYVGPSVVAHVDLAGACDLLFGIKQHLFPLRDPSAGTGNSEQHREHGDRESHRLVDQARIEIDIGVKLAGDEIFILQSDALDFEGDIKQRIAAHDIENFVGNVLDDPRTGIVILVNPVTEAHQALLAGFDALDIGGDVGDRADIHKHAQNFLIGATMQGA